MGLPTISYCNFLAETGVTATARTQNSTYPASNILKPNVTHLYRSNSKSVDLDGTNDYFWVAHHSDFNCADALTMFAVVKPDTAASTRTLIHKYDGANGYYMLLYEGEIWVLIANSASVTGTVKTTASGITALNWYKIKGVYNPTNHEVIIYLNSVEIARANNSTQTGCTLTGSLPDPIGTNTGRVTIGANAASGNCFNGEAALACIANIEAEHGGWIQKGICAGYWDFDSSDGTDSSGNGHDLTGESIGPGNYENCTALQLTGFVFPATKNPTFVVLDRRHNLTSTATVRLLRTSWNAGYGSVAVTNVTAGKPVVMCFSSSSAISWWLEIHDPDNPDGYIEIPHVWLGEWQDLAGSYGDEGGYIRRAVVAGRGATSTILTRVGSRLGPVLYEFELPWKFKDADRAIWEAAMAYAATDPMVLTLDRDDLDDTTYLVDWLGVHLGSMQGRGELVLRKKTATDDAHSETLMIFSECGAGVDQ